MKESIRLSLCMMTKNDETYLADSLRDWTEYADEIIVADLGSNDKTIELAKQVGASVYQVPFENDFSAVKNFCLEKAKGRWVLFLQADEIIPIEQRKNLDVLLDNPNVEGYLLYIDYNSQEYGVFSPVQSLRLLRRRSEYRFQYRSFERIPDEKLINLEDADIQIVHQNDVVQAWDFSLRKQYLLEELHQSPDDSYLRYLYGIELINEQKLEESVVQFEKARAGVSFAFLYTPHLLKCYCWALLCLERYEEALPILDEGIPWYTYYADLLVLRGEVYRQLGRFAEAITDFNTCIRMRERPKYLVPGPEISVDVVWEALGELYEQTMQDHNALECYLQVAQMEGWNPELVRKVYTLVEKTQEQERIEKLLHASMEENTEFYLMWIDLLFEQKGYAEVLRCIEQLESLHGNIVEMEQMKRTCLSLLSEPQDQVLFFANTMEDRYLLAAIEDNWIHGQWRQAEALLLHAQQNQGRDSHFVPLYRYLHALLTGEKICSEMLENEEYERTFLLYETMIRFGQEEKAKILLSALWNGQDPTYGIELAKPWAKYNVFSMLEFIFQHLPNEEIKEQFQVNILAELLYFEHEKTAQKLLNLGGFPIPEDISCVLWSNCKMQELQKWVMEWKGIATEKVQQSKRNRAKPAQKAEQALLNFYQSATRNATHSKLKNQDITEELTAADIHSKIGVAYEKQGKKALAIVAYLNALVEEPLHAVAQEKIRRMAEDEPQLYTDLLAKIDWSVKSDIFSDQKEFSNYINAVIAVQKKQFDQAIALLSNMGTTEALKDIQCVYQESCIWLNGDQQAEMWNKERWTEDKIALLFRVCKSDIINTLSEKRTQFPCSGLLQREFQRVQEITCSQSPSSGAIE